MLRCSILLLLWFIAAVALAAVPAPAPRRRLQFPQPAPAGDITATNSPAPTDDEYYYDGDNDGEANSEGNGDDYYDAGPTTSPWPTSTYQPTQASSAVDVPAVTPATPGNPAPGAPANATLPSPSPWGSVPVSPSMMNETTSAPVPAPVPVPGLPVTTTPPTATPGIVITAVPTEGTDDGYGDDGYGDDGYDLVPTMSPAPTIADGPEPTPTGDDYPWSNPYVATPNPTVKYRPPDDDVLETENDDKIKQEWAEKTKLEKAEAEWDDIRKDRNVKIVSIVFGVTGFLLLVFVAHQLIENPDGIFGKLCRCVLACVGILCCPIRALCCRTARARDRRTHQLVTNEPGTYGYSHDLELT